MDLKTMALEYAAGGQACRKRAEELRQCLNQEALGEMEKLRLRRRVQILVTMARDSIATSRYLEHYYDHCERRCSRI